MTIAVEAERLRRSFGEVEALAGIDLSVPQGSVLGLLGPNGAGKTTAVRILSTVLTPTGGSARVLGHDVVAEPDAVRASIGLAGQFAAVDDNLTGRENLWLIGRLTHIGRDRIRTRADELLDRFRLSDAGDRPVRTYSGGMRRRLDLAAALVHEPKVLFLDEPTTGLDPVSRMDLWQVVEGLVSDGTTVLLTTQYLEEADRLAEHIVLIDHGEAVAEGSAAELKSQLGATVVEFVMADAAAAGHGREVLTKLDLGTVGGDGVTVGVTVADGPRAMLGALRALDAAGVVPAAANIREPTLDDVFLALTGSRATGEEGDER